MGKVGVGCNDMIVEDFPSKLLSPPSKEGCGRASVQVSWESKSSISKLPSNNFAT